MKARLLFSLPLLSLGLTTALLAQDGKTTQNLRTSSTSQTAEEVEDLGVIAPAGPVSFRGGISAFGTYTSNAKLSGNHTSSDFLSIPSLSGGFTAQLGNGFSFDFDARVETVIYSRYDEHSFVGYTALATLDWRPKPNLPRIYIGAEPYRYDSFDTGDRISQAIGLTAGTDWGFSFNHQNSLALIGYSFSHYFADPTIDSRSTHRFVAGITHQLRPQLYAQLLYSYQWSNYENFDRHDSRHLVQLNLIYQFNRHLFGTLGGNWIDNDSDSDRASYQSAGATAGLNWTFF